ncbi:MAG: glycosyl transferase family 4, partial [Betaproteobacteria bacterium]
METGAFVSMLAPPLAGMVSTAIGLVLVRSRSLPLDKPNERSLHVFPVPRTGGIAIMSGIVAAAMVLHTDYALLGPVAALAIASYFDDRHTLPALLRLAIHLLAAGVYLWMAGVAVATATFIALLLAITWLTNLYNFMDGSDGLAGGMTVIGFATYGLAAGL